MGTRAFSYRGPRGGTPGIGWRRPTCRAISASMIEATRRNGADDTGSRPRVATLARFVAVASISTGLAPTMMSCRLPCVSGSRWRGVPGPEGVTKTTSAYRAELSGVARWTRSGFLWRRAAARASRRTAEDPPNQPAPRSSSRTSWKPKAAADRRLDPTSTWSSPAISSDGLRASGRLVRPWDPDPRSTYQAATAAAAATLSVVTVFDCTGMTTTSSAATRILRDIPRRSLPTARVASPRSGRRP